MEAKEIVHCAHQIEKSIADRSYGNILTLLGDLHKARITAEQLEMTDIVKVLYRLLKSCSDTSVKKEVKSLLSKWKKEYSKDTRGLKCTDKEEELPCRVPVPESGDGVSSCRDFKDQEEEKETSSLISEPSLQTPSTDSISASSDPVRTKCVQLLLAALCAEPPDRDKATGLAGDIERHIHELHRPNQLKYKACVRSKVANLRNPKNGHLRQGLLSGSLPPQAFAGMSAEEMAGEELRQLRKEYSTQGVSERQLPQGIEGTQTRKIRCQRCGGSDCRVTQVSRGALFLPAWVKGGGPGEDAMTFVTCSGCGQQWYHSGWVCL
ncbi:transcription elongation factor A N-terminal and central domain-containing protein [Mugil cephalus]|uniref:transcription elongation factor A N-terminal and central domain-containing protein n=1 Tax=Mugil cephalus TaxID=48193 RepID=UPI001FB6BBD7|nr:transcription elongation factor A N-terminal and central domain-containing protein [Mugil cephalus]XP_047432024.1 transcription elongation factor A N-terminal and central domain-containing protein [Mugil cephalus]